MTAKEPIGRKKPNKEKCLWWHARVFVLGIKQLNQLEWEDMLPAKNDVKCAVFLLNGKVFSAHAVDTDFVQSQEIKGTN